MGEQYLFHTLNTARAKVGLPPVAWSEELAYAAAQHVERMCKEGELTHRVAEEADLPDRVAAANLRFTLVSENLGMAQSAQEIQSIWMESPGHRDNILDPTITSVGIALLDRDGAVWAVEDFTHTIQELSLSQQEALVSQLLRSAGLSAAASDAARNMCNLESNYLGRRPAFVMHFQTGDLTHLPLALLQRVKRGKVSAAEVGACVPPGKNFAPFRIAVALYP